ncbi:hypothetical protein HMPREF2991_03120 [Streptococcus sp. HMSC072D07]|jgi:hypothetical protein|uniref:Cas9 inhibitor AcrIIA9 family protein n=1 Tax=Streptococcus sp. HMSC072D07 TaxID=1739495 RepID=UPI0008A28DFF|nr:Cas9 inhibitor AcrIIA9 family protein [Streptococcus sp. HMSC072D07]OFP34716.1 hypothetical protein HMPREF2991_03120 [Streptococcus sp. HMSC072D07]
MENNVIEKEAVVNEFMLTLAEAKLLEELSEPHSPDLDLIHNLLCDELPHDTDLVTGILKEGRSIGGAYKYAYDLAFKQYQSMEHKVDGVRGAAVHHTKVLEWVVEYFKLEHIEVEKPKPVAKPVVNLTASDLLRRKLASVPKVEEVLEVVEEDENLRIEKGGQVTFDLFGGEVE